MDLEDIQIKQQNKLRNLALKLLFVHIDKKIDNLDQSFSTTMSMMKEQIKDIQTPFDKEQQLKQISLQLQIFVQELKQISRIWVKMLKTNKIEGQGNKYTLNQSIVLTQVYQQFIQKVNNRIQQKIINFNSQKVQQSCKTKQLIKKQFDFESYYFDQTGISLASMIFNFIAKQIVVCFQQSKAHIIQQTQRVEQLIKASQIMNSYILFGLLKQMSKQTQKNIKQKFKNTFVGVSIDVCNQFSHFVQLNYETIHLHYKQSEDGIIMINEQRKKYIQQQTDKLIFLFLSNTVKKVQSHQNLANQLQIQQQMSNELVKRTVEQNNQIILKNNKKQGKWKIIDVKDSVSQVYKLFKTGIKTEIATQTSKTIQKDIMACGIPQSASANIGGSLGKCLADIDKYKTANQFFLDLSKVAMVGGSITIMLQEIPILNYFVIAGGLSYTVYKSYKDQITSSIKKLKQVGQASVVAVGAVGSTITGMVLGQILLPIPFLGAFVGGIIGGFIGQKGTRKLNSILNNQSFMRLIKFLRESIIQNRRWEYSDQLLQKLGINKKYFQDSFSLMESQKHAWITGLCFCIVAHYESRRNIEHTHNKLKQKQLKKQVLQKQNENSKNIEKMSNQIQINDFFQNQFDIVAIIDYLTVHEVYLLQCLLKLEVSVRHLLKQ